MFILSLSIFNFVEQFYIACNMKSYVKVCQRVLLLCKTLLWKSFLHVMSSRHVLINLNIQVPKIFQKCLYQIIFILIRRIEIIHLLDDVIARKLRTILHVTTTRWTFSKYISLISCRVSWESGWLPKIFVRRKKQNSCKTSLWVVNL